MAFVQTGVKDFLHTLAAVERTPAADGLPERGPDGTLAFGITG